MTRILSAFKILKRVGFAVLLLSANSYSHAQPPDTLWTISIGGPMFDEAFCSMATSHGGVLVAGQGDLDPPYTGLGALCLKISSQGELVWHADYREWGFRSIRSIAHAQNQDIIMTGESFGTSQLAVLRADSNGQVIWYREYQIGLGGSGASIVESSDGTLAAITRGTCCAGNSLALVKISESGDSLWTRTYGGNDFELGGSIDVTPEGGFLIVGSLGTESLDLDSWILRLDSDGNVVWDQHFGSDNNEWITDGFLSPDGSTVISGYLEETSPEHLFFPYVARVDSIGDTVWTQVYRGGGEARLTGIAQSLTGLLTVCGFTSSFGAGGADFYLGGISEDGSFDWFTSFGTAANEYCMSMCYDVSGNAILAGYGFSELPETDIFVVKTEPTLVAAPIIPKPETRIALVSCYPNPFNNYTRISIFLDAATHASVQITDILGRQVFARPNELLLGGYHDFMFDGRGLCSGTYFCHVLSNQGIVSTQMVLVR